MSNYIVDFQSGGVETSPTIPGKTSIVLPQSITDSSSTAITLTGRGVPNYGEIQQENFIRLLENFASKNAPLHPTIGQLWFDSTVSSLKVYGMDQTWHLISGNGVVAGPTPPSGPTVGQLWYDTANDILNVWNGSAWVPLGGGLSTGPTPPSTATEGMLWYSTTDKILYVKVNPATVDPDYPLYVDGTWSQVWPHVVQYAAWVEYNDLATRINRVIGAPSTFGSPADPADANYGWSQTDVLEVFTSFNLPSPFDNTKWTTLVSRLRKALRHTTSVETAVPTMGYIRDGRGPNPNATLYTPNVTWASGWQGNGIAGMNTNWAALQAGVTALETNRFTVNAIGGQIIAAHSDSTQGSTWASTRVLDLAFQFSSAAAAKAYFNSGSAARFTISLASGSGVGFEWYNTIHNALLDTSGFVIDYKGCKIGLTGAYINGASSIGFYDLTTSFQTLYTIARGGAYGTGSFVVTAKYDPVTFVMTVRLSFNEDFAAGQVSNKLTVATDLKMPVSAAGGLPHVDTPVLPAPSITTSGTFLTAPAGT